MIQRTEGRFQDESQEQCPDGAGSPQIAWEKKPPWFYESLRGRKLAQKTEGLELKAQGRAGHWLMRRKPVNPFVKVNSTPFENIGITQDVLRIPNRLLFELSVLKREPRRRRKTVLYISMDGQMPLLLSGLCGFPKSFKSTE